MRHPGCGLGCGIGFARVGCARVGCWALVCGLLGAVGLGKLVTRSAQHRRGR